MAHMTYQYELTQKKLASIGHPTGYYQRDDLRFTAVTSSFRRLFWPARAIYDGHRLHYRVTLFEGEIKRRIALFDEATFPINDIDFHPNQPILAIATGSYDGGYFFEGDIWLWNWETGEQTNLLNESREVTHCRFLDENQLEIIIRPPDEGDFDEDVFNQFFRVILNLSDSQPNPASDNWDERLQELEPVKEEALTFILDKENYMSAPKIAQLQVDPKNGLSSRGLIWDICWISDEEVGVVHDNCHFEVWHTGGERQFTQGGSGFGTQILKHPQGLIINVVERKSDPQWHSTLYLYQKEALTILHQFEYPVSISQNKSGDILCRDCRLRLQGKKRNDLILSSDFSTLFLGNLGHYDSFNHYLQLNNGPTLAFLQGTPPSSHQQKQLCQLTPSGVISQKTVWDNQPVHLMGNNGIWVSNDEIIRSFKLYNPKIKQDPFFIERLELSTGISVWKQSISALVTAMKRIGDTYLLYALTNGRFGIIDINSGKHLFEESLIIDKVPTVGLSLDVRNHQVAIGTIDGRIALYEFTE